jgi:hypothetical protein
VKLDVARLCLDCEEIHDAQQCPSCGSEAFGFLTRWVPAAAEPVRHRRPPEPPARAEAYRRLLSGEPRRPSTGRLLARGALGLAAFGLAGWIWRASRRHEHDPHAGD